MAIPKRADIQRVILQVLPDGSVRHTSELQEVVATHFQLTEDDLRRKRGKQFAFRNEHAFALNGLVHQRLIEEVDPPNALLGASIGWKGWYRDARIARTRSEAERS